MLYNAPKFIKYSEQNLFYFTATNADELSFRMSDNTEFTYFVRLSSSNTCLRTKNKPTCAIALMMGSLRNIKALCKLHLLYRSLKPAVYVIADGKLLISNT